MSELNPSSALHVSFHQLRTFRCIGFGPLSATTGLVHCSKEHLRGRGRELPPPPAHRQRQRRSGETRPSGRLLLTLARTSTGWIAPALPGAFSYSITSSARTGTVGGADLRATGFMECGSRRAELLCLDIRGPDHLSPLPGVFGDELAEVGGRARQHRAAEVVKPRRRRRISESCIDLLV
jgi:hypothetical protein